MKDEEKTLKINYSPNRLYIPNHPYRILIIGVSASDKTNVLTNLTKYQQPDIDKIHLLVKDPFESDYQYLNEREKVGIEKLKNPTAFTDYPQTTDYFYENLEDYNLTKKRKVLVVFQNMIALMEANKK